MSKKKKKHQEDWFEEDLITKIMIAAEQSIAI